MQVSNTKSQERGGDKVILQRVPVLLQVNRTVTGKSVTGRKSQIAVARHRPGRPNLAAASA